MLFPHLLSTPCTHLCYFQYKCCSVSEDYMKIKESECFNEDGVS
uniref:Uncharacterized protein n=1 Tax=Arundo donax TaxID=35708 RepID=A0A0A9E7M1_ARUDO